VSTVDTQDGRRRSRPRGFTSFLGRSPDTSTSEDLRRFQLHQTQIFVRPPSINQVLLGHAKLENTALYTRVATKTIQQVPSPLEHIALKLKATRESPRPKDRAPHRMAHNPDPEALKGRGRNPGGVWLCGRDQRLAVRS
jgi:hypothetical protein